MQEIAHGIYIEDSYLGVTLGAISLPHGLILVDAPPRPEDVRTWRSTLLNLGGGVDRLLVNLDLHIDRTLGARAMECTVVAHEKTSQVFRNRPTTFKGQNTETGAEWEQINGLGSIRWSPPEVTFTNQMLVHWGDHPVSLEYHPGPNPGAIWIVLDEPRVIFLGDAVVTNQPPFLGSADLPAWIETLQPLLSSTYRDYSLVSGRNGLVSQDEIRKLLDLLKQINAQLEKSAAAKEPPEITERMVPKLLSRLEIPTDRQEMYAHRLRWGLNHYYTRHYRPSAVEGEE